MPAHRFVTVDPGHFHAALVQKEMYGEIAPVVHVYAPMGPDLVDFLARIARFNQRAQNPTRWEMEVHATSNYLERMAAERAGDIAIFSGRNRGKIDKILAALEAGFHVLADKPWIIRSQDRHKLARALDLADEKGLVAYDIMTERYEITSMLQRELVNSPAVFGTMEKGSAAEPAVYMESIHHIFKLVAGIPNPRPAWFFEVDEQGEALADVGTHLVDLVQWTLFPDASMDAATDTAILSASRWPTVVTPDQFRAVTGESRREPLDYFCNTSVLYTLRGVHVKLDVLWNWEAPAGTGDTHFAVYRGTRSRVEVRQSEAENYRPELYVVADDAAVAGAIRARVDELQQQYPGIGVEKRSGSDWLVSIPDSYRVGHEAHFAQVTSRFLDYLNHPGTLPAWEKPDMLAKYGVCTVGVDRSHSAGAL